MRCHKRKPEQELIFLSELKPKRRQEILEFFSFIGSVEAERDTCGNCVHWRGRCDRGKINRLASSTACESFWRR